MMPSLLLTAITQGSDSSLHCHRLCMHGCLASDILGIVVVEGGGGRQFGQTSTFKTYKISQKTCVSGNGLVVGAQSARWVCSVHTHTHQYVCLASVARAWGHLTAHQSAQSTLFALQFLYT